MVIKGKSRGAPSQLAVYLRRKGQNERVELREIKGTVSQNIGAALTEMAALASLTRCKKFLYHASINPKAEEHLTPEQWARAVDTLGKRLGLDGHQRIVVEHIKMGRAHYHIVWNRVGADNLKAVKMSHNYEKHEQVARALERHFGLARVQGAFVGCEDAPRPRVRAAKRDAERRRRAREEARAMASAVCGRLAAAPRSETVVPKAGPHRAMPITQRQLIASPVP